MSTANSNAKRRRDQVDDSDLFIVEPTEVEQLVAMLKGDILNGLGSLKDISEALNEYRGGIRKVLRDASRLDWSSQGRDGPPQPSPLTSEMLTGKLKAKMLIDREGTIREIAQFIEQSVPYTFVSILEQDFAETSYPVQRMAYAGAQWAAWKPEQILSGIKAAGSAELKIIREMLTSRREEQKLFLEDCQLSIKKVLDLSAKDLTKLKQKTSSCKDDETALLNMLRNFDWTGKLNPTHLKPALDALIQLKLSKAISTYSVKRKFLSVRIGQIPKTANASKIVYLGIFPVLSSLNDDIMKLPCIAACKDDSLFVSDAKRAKQMDNNAKPADELGESSNTVKPEKEP
jgi:hypothetical protein